MAELQKQCPLEVKHCQYYQETANLYPLLTSKTYLHTLSRPGNFFCVCVNLLVCVCACVCFHVHMCVN